jgi:hypothetical protein
MMDHRAFGGRLGRTGLDLERGLVLGLGWAIMLLVTLG